MAEWVTKKSGWCLIENTFDWTSFPGISVKCFEQSWELTFILYFRFTINFSVPYRVCMTSLGWFHLVGSSHHFSSFLPVLPAHHWLLKRHDPPINVLTKQNWLHKVKRWMFIRILMLSLKSPRVTPTLSVSKKPRNVHKVSPLNCVYFQPVNGTWKHLLTVFTL